MRTWQCGSVTCNCGIAVREGDDVIVLDMCFDGIPRLRFASKKTPSEGTFVKRDPTGKSFVVSEAMLSNAICTQKQVIKSEHLKMVTNH